MKAFKIEILIIDLDEIGKDQIIEALENTRYPNRCISPDVKSVEEKDIGEWHDDHTLNKTDECEDFYNKMFNSKNAEKIQMAEQQILGFHSAKSGDSWADLVNAMGLTMDEYNQLEDEDMICYLSDAEKEEIREAVFG